MDIEAATKELEAGFNGEAQTPEATPATTTAPSPAQAAKVEELEIMYGGKPFKLPVNTEFPVKHNGQILKTPLEKLLNGFRQSTHNEEKLKELKAKLEQYGDFDQFKQARDKFGQIQDWSEKNPKDWERLWTLFQQKDRALLGGEQPVQNQANEQLINELAELKQKYGELSEWKSTFDRQQEEKQLAEDEKLVNGDIESFTKDFPELDLNEKTLDGITLKSVIMNHGIKKGIGEFRLAALDYFGPRIAEILVARGRNEATQAVKRDTQQGIVARGSKPFLGQSNQVNPKLDANERTAAATAELERMFSAG